MVNTMTIHDCIHEDEIHGQSRKITELETRADYKERMIRDLNEKMEKIDKKLDNIDHCLTDLKLQSERDDFNIDTRVTRLENTQNVLKWVTGLGLTAVCTAVSVLAFLITYVK